MIHFQSVKIKLTLWYALVLALLLSIFSLLMVTELSRVLYQDVDKNLQNEALAIQKSAEPYMENMFEGIVLGDREKTWQHPYYLPTEARIKVKDVINNWERGTRRFSQSTLTMRLIGIDGKALRTNFKGWEREIIFPDYERDANFMENGQTFQTIHFQKKPFRIFYKLIKYQNHPVFILQSAAPMEVVKSAIERLYFVILVSIPGAVLAACAAGWFLAKRSLKPIDLMIKEARQITAAYLKSRLPRSNTHDELDRLAETLNEMIDRLEASTKSIQDFSSDISHELKTPLAIIRGEVDLALRKSRTPEELIKTLQTVGEEVNELIRLVDDLMLLVRSDSRQLRFEKKRISLKEIINLMASRYQDRAASRGLTIRTDIAADLFIQGDDIYIKRLFSNLIDNAIKFTPTGGMIDLELKKFGNRAVAGVKDTGIGIELDIQAKVFSRFFRSDSARSHEGAGLGLNIAKAICSGHSAEISIVSAPYKGTLVSVSFPILS